MPRTADAILVTEGEAGIDYTIPVKRGGVAVDLTGYTVTMWAHENQPEGTNQIDGESATITGAATLGIVTYTITAADTTIADGKSLKGTWRLRLVNGAIIEWTKPRTFEIAKNEMVA